MRKNAASYCGSSFLPVIFMRTCTLNAHGCLISCLISYPFAEKSCLISQVTLVHPILCHHFAKSGLFNINSFDLEDNGSGAVIAAGNHDFIIICPSMHDRSALQCGINISADGVPCF